MEVTVHLPVSLISDLISRALGGHTCLELCKIYRYADLNSGFTVIYKMVFVGEAGAGFALVAQPLVAESRAYHGWRIFSTIRCL